MRAQALWTLVVLGLAVFGAALFSTGCDFSTEGDQDYIPSDDDAPAGDDTYDGDDDTGDDDESLDVLDEVNTFIGTGGMPLWGFGCSNPGPLVPNGLVKLGPDTGMGSLYIAYMHMGGYWWPDTVIRGFSHTHMSGTGIVDYGNINLMPVTGISDDKVLLPGYRSKFSHKSEIARPGYYRVHLNKYGIDAELTATRDVGVHRDTFPAGGESPYIIIDSSYTLSPNASWGGEIHVDAQAGEVYGYVLNHGGFSNAYGGLNIYFAARFSEPIVDFGTVKGGVRHAGAPDQEGRNVAAYVGFDHGVTSVVSKVGISLVSVEQARANIDDQVPGWDFDDIRDNAEAIWRDRLGSIDVTGGTETQRRIFFSSLYRLDTLPTNQSESGGVYMGFDRVAHLDNGRPFYSDLSLWDTFRTTHPLLELIRPEQNGDIIESFRRIDEQGGGYPRWAQGIGETEVMIGTHADTVVADAYLKGNDDFDIEDVYQGLRRHAVARTAPGGRSGIEDWLGLGYVAEDHQDQSVSRTLEYSLNDYCLARIADELGYDSDAAMFMERAYNYHNVWDSETGYFRPRLSDGEWDPDFSTDVGLLPNGNGFTEGNARHWLWFVLHDPVDLVELNGGADTFAARLEEFFVLGQKERTQLFPQPYYWHGNEPDMHAAYFFNEAGRPDLAQYWVRWVMDNRYDDSPNGLDGNDDGGTLSAWYIFSALGFYPLPCTNRYEIGSPIFERAVMKLGNGATLEILAPGAGPGNIYVHGVTINGVALEHPWFDHEQIANGGTIVFELGASPGTWGR